VDYLLNQPKDYRLIVPTIVVAEYLTAQEIETVSGRLRSESYLALFEKIDLTFEIAEILGQILRRKTYALSADTGDLIIAATAIYLNAELATRNKSDFSKIPNLRFFDPKNLN
jgi:predicted nucleic acid-binding protein